MDWVEDPEGEGEMEGEPVKLGSPLKVVAEEGDTDTVPLERTLFDGVEVMEGVRVTEYEMVGVEEVERLAAPELEGEGLGVKSFEGDTEGEWLPLGQEDALMVVEAVWLREGLEDTEGVVLSRGVPVGEMVGRVVADTEAVVEGEREEDALAEKEAREDRVTREVPEVTPVTLPLPELDHVYSEVTLARDVPEGGAAVLEARGEVETLLDTEGEKDTEGELEGVRRPDPVEVALDPVEEEEGEASTVGVADAEEERVFRGEEEEEGVEVWQVVVVMVLGPEKVLEGDFE